MAENSFLKDIESRYDCSTVKVNNLNVWSFLRTIYYFEETYSRINADKFINLGKLQYCWNLLRNSFYGFSNWFSRYDMVVFTTTTLRREHDGEFFDKSFDHLVDSYGSHRVLFIEVPSSKLDGINERLYSTQAVHSRHIVSNTLPFILTLFFSLFFKKTLKINAESILKDINTEFNLSIDYSRYLARLFSGKFIYKIILRFLGAKKLLINCYYTNQDIILAAKELGLPIIEIQHGVLNPCYFSRIESEKLLIPDILLCWGEKHKKELEMSTIYTPESIKILAPWYLMAIQKTTSINPFPEKGINVLVTLQDQIEVDTIKIIDQLARLSPDINYFLLPRISRSLQYYKDFYTAPNVHIMLQANFYTHIQHATIHCTVYSTTCLEAPFFGIPNLLIDFEGQANSNFYSLLSDHSYNYFAKNITDAQVGLKLLLKTGQKKIRALHSDVISTDYERELSTLINELNQL